MHVPREALDEALESVLDAPADHGTLELVVRRPDVEEREILLTGRLTVAEGLEGDNWNRRGSSRTSDGGPHPDMQLNVISARVSDLLADGDTELRALAGDQLHVDLDITESNLPPGTRLGLGSAVIEVTEQPHRGCAKFAARFGADARRWVNSGDGDGLRLRGLNARVVVEGDISPGDTITKLS
ncbi:MAG: MOSC domain-containing protein [Microthrixaceae bacterium]